MTASTIGFGTPLLSVERSRTTLLATMEPPSPMTVASDDGDTMRRVVAADAAFTEFNTRRTFRVEDGEFEQRRFGAAVAVRDPTRDDPYYNRVLGLGDAQLASLDEIVAFHHDVGQPCSVALTSDRSTPAVLDVLRERGFRLADTCTFFALSCSIAEPCLSPGIPIRRAHPADLRALVELWSEDSDEPIAPDAVERRAAAQWDPAFPIYVAELDGRIAAMATLFLHGGVAWLANANTLRSFRRRGCQLALVHHRLAEASALGCDLAISDTTTWGSTSHRNLERAGLHMSHVQMTLSLSVGS